ncbi:hypothetical protein MNBD_NITROSPIRAE01-1541 [hydrothermal vent metagenome]|uniref:Uncharacterized protein n=1 Tax=hydrothermal vent metagenome TaxID=652676 RepID=A0A3B1DWJ7_9ZZZZ
MPEVLIFDKVMRPEELYQACLLTPKQLYCGEKFGGLMPLKPYVLGDNPSQEAISIANTLNASKNPPALFKLISLLGPDDSVDVASIMSGLKDFNIAATGAATSTYSTRIKTFGESVKSYQDTLMSYRDTVTSSETSASAQASAKEAVKNTFEDMQKNFQQELSRHKKGRTTKGSPLKSATRGINLARSARNTVKLNISSTTQAGYLVRLSQFGNVLGNGIVIVDAFTRVGNIHVSALSGEDWYRQMFVESSSIAASLAVGKITVEAGLYFLTVATPAGWVGLLITGAAIAGVAAAASMTADSIVKKEGGAIYDSIMKWTNSQ